MVLEERYSIIGQKIHELFDNLLDIFKEIGENAKLGAVVGGVSGAVISTTQVYQDCKMNKTPEDLKLPKSR